MSSSENTSPTMITDTIQTNNQTLLTINMTNVSKLTTTNYLMWSLQIHALLDGYDLAGHLDGSIPIPAATITNGDQISVNPAFTMWKRQDKLIFSALIGAISTPLQPLVSRVSTSSEIWNTFASTYAKPSRGHIMQLRNQLKIWKKENKTIDEYLQGIIIRLDQLALLGSTMAHEDQIDLVLGGLPDEYKSVVEQIEGRDAPPSITELHERLLNHEAKLLTRRDVVFSPAPITANVIQHRNNNHNYRNNQNRQKHTNNNNNNNQWSSSSQPPNWQTNQHQQNAEARGPRPYLGRCQLCGVQGHSAKRCSKLQMFQASNQPQATPFTSWNPRANMAIGSLLL